MLEPVRPSTVLPAQRTPFTVTTSDGQTLIGEVSAPLENYTGAILSLHPLPTAGGMMDSHVYKKAANRLPAMAGIEVIRFNSRGTSSEAGTSTGEFDNGNDVPEQVLVTAQVGLVQLEAPITTVTFLDPVVVPLTQLKEFIVPTNNGFTATL